MAKAPHLLIVVALAGEGEGMENSVGGMTSVNQKQQPQSVWGHTSPTSETARLLFMEKSVGSREPRQRWGLNDYLVYFFYGGGAAGVQGLCWHL